MPAPKRVTIDVNVVHDTTKPGGVWFNLGYKHVSGGDKVKFENENHPGFIVRFNIVDTIGSGCKFLPNLQDAMWVQTINGPPPYPCPTAPAYWPVFEATGFDNDYETLVVRNFNPPPAQLFAFTLRFNKPGWPTSIDYDPIGDNKNGPQQYKLLTLVIYGALICSALIAGLAAFTDLL